MKIYLAGPMRNFPYFNFPAFDAAAINLRAQGHDVISPAELDRTAGCDPNKMPADSDWSQPPAGFDFAAAIRRDIEAIFECEAVCLLPGWRDSTGAAAERAIGLWLRRKVFEYEPETVLDEAARITAADRQAAYGPPGEDFTRTAAMWSAAFGHEFQARDVAIAMVLLKVSRLRHADKRDSWVDIAGYAHCGHQCSQR